MKLQSFFGDVSVLKVCKFNKNHAIKFYKCSGKKVLPNVYQKMFLVHEESWQNVQLSMIAYSLII